MHQLHHSAEAAGLLPTFVNEASVYRYLDDTDAKMGGVLGAWNAKPGLFTVEEKNRFNSLLGRWREFFKTERNTSHWLDAKSTMDAIDPLVEELKAFDTMARARGSVPVTPPVERQPDSIFSPSSLPSVDSIALLLAALAAVLLASKS